MKTYYVKYVRVHGIELLPWMQGPLVRVTRNRIGREVREWVCNPSLKCPKPPCAFGDVEVNVDAIHMMANDGFKRGSAEG